MLLGNKADMASERVIGPEDGEKLAKVSTVAGVKLHKLPAQYKNNHYMANYNQKIKI